MIAWTCSISADDTPTPTRLIRNCEELGLFDDVNPFDEKFREAINNDSLRPSVLFTTQKSLEVIKPHDDELHTPIIFSVKRNTDVIKQEVLENEVQNKVVVISDEVALDVKPSNGDGPVAASKPINRKKRTKRITTDATEPKTLRKIIPKPTMIPLNISNPIKEKIRNSLLKMHTPRPEKTVCAAQVSVINLRISTTPEIRVIPKHDSPQPAKKNITPNNGTCERNREAAKRYRRKQKMQNDDLMRRNAELEAENARLKMQLQNFARIHANCCMARN